MTKRSLTFLLRAAAAAVLGFSLAGCMYSGGLYRNTVKPLERNFDNTPVGTKSCVISAYKVKEPVSGYGLSAEWDTSYILRAMKEAGMSRACHMELHDFSIFFGTYSRRQIVVYGD